MQAAREALATSRERVTIVGDDDAGVLAEAIRRLGPQVVHRSIADLGQGDGPVIAVGIAAADGGATVRRRIGADGQLLVVVSKDDVEARLEAYRQRAAVVAASIATDTARTLVDELRGEGLHGEGQTGEGRRGEGRRDEGRADLGWVTFGEIVDAATARLATRLGTGRAPDTQVRLGDGREIAAAIDAFADAIAARCHGTKARESRPPRSDPPPRAALPPAAPVEELDWEDDPQTMEADAREVERFRRLTASQKAEVLGSLLKGRPSGQIEAPKLWSRSDSEPPTRADHRPLMDEGEERSPDARVARREPSGVVPTVRGRRAPSERAVRTSSIREVRSPRAAPVESIPLPGNPLPRIDALAPDSTPSIELPALPEDDEPSGTTLVSVPEPALERPRKQAKLTKPQSYEPQPAAAEDRLPAVLDPENVYTAPQRAVSATDSDELVGRWRADEAPRHEPLPAYAEIPETQASLPALRSPLRGGHPRHGAPVTPPAIRAAAPTSAAPGVLVWALLLVLAGAGAAAAWLLFGA